MTYSFGKKCHAGICSSGTRRAIAKRYTVAHPCGSASSTAGLCNREEILYRLFFVVCFKTSKESLSHCIPQQDDLQHLHQSSGAYLILLIYLLTNLAAALQCKLQRAQRTKWSMSYRAQVKIMMVAKLQNNTHRHTTSVQELHLQKQCLGLRLTCLRSK